MKVGFRCFRAPVHEYADVVSVVGLLLSGGGTEQEFAYYSENRKSHFVFPLSEGSERLALIEPIAYEKAPQ